MISKYSVTVAGRETVAAGVVALTLATADGSELPRWRPGAHIDVTLPTGPTRQYSLCGDPADRSSWRIAVLLEQPSRGGSAWIHDHATVGTPLTVSAPRNLFELEPAKSYVFVAGGVGITPLLPMITDAERTGTPWALWYGGRSRSSMAFADDLVPFGDRVHLMAGERIPLSEALGTPGDGVAVYCCGPESMISAVEAACDAWQPGTLHVERFVSDGAPVTGSTGFDVHCAQSGVDVRVEEGTSVLDALLAAGVEADYSCTQGFCGTCETPVLEGVPDHRDEYLDHSGTPDTMMICVSRSRCPKLVLDI
ncbi:PDR/VanB family oxidoreductase [Amycolatopsis sp. NPDC048633]|uniref:PDR/VanB family oxidoreductase n=1 Tax=Amycolatopsis sp. NPDC048633 TaxID=3157095 RepID=UPI0033D3E65A